MNSFYMCPSCSFASFVELQVFKNTLASVEAPERCINCGFEFIKSDLEKGAKKFVEDYLANENDKPSS